MPDYVAQRLMVLLNRAGKALNGSRVVLVGLSYKRNTGDIRESPSLRLIDVLKDLGAQIVGIDDRVEDHRWPAGVERAPYAAETLADADAIVLVTDHEEFDLALLANSTVPVLDTKNRVNGPAVERL
ncbi:UDP binding domain-containing protein [Leifsonia xyli]|uniref:UDP binding domain-containing protein n=1 Tax=Leifsonia xyli TaxID=1575 RepID=UPI003D668A55